MRAQPITQRQPAAAADPPWLPYLHLGITATLVVVHPLLDLLAGHPEFFLARHLDYGAVVRGCLLLLLVAPLPLVLTRLVLAALGPNLARGFDATVVAAAAVIFALQVGRASRLDAVGRPGLAVAAGVLASVVVFLWLRVRSVRTFYSFLAPALIAVPALFLLHPQIRELAVQPLRPPPIAAAEVADVPIVMVVFDALSASAVMDSRREVNRLRFPHLAALAEDSLWFTQAGTVARWTSEVIPALLSGRYPEAAKLPSLAHHPHNLFTALAASHRIVAVEPVFPLCPPEWNRHLATANDGDDPWRSLVSDLALIYLHRTLHPAFSRSLPPIDQGWGHFNPRTPSRGVLDPLDRFLATLGSHSDPALYYLHLVFPHMPYQFLPSGRIFQQRPEPFPTLVRPGESAPADTETQIFLYKRYLLQAGHVDHLIAQLVRRLRDTELYERALVVVTSDHGGRTAPFHVSNDIFSVPLLIKLPYQVETGTRDRRVNVLDLVPSLLDLLGTKPPWTTDGRSFFADDYRPPDRYFSQDRLVPSTDATWTGSQALIEWKIEHFGLGDDPLSLYRAGSPQPELLGVPLDRLALHPAPHLSAELEDGGPFIKFDPESRFAPVLLRGSLYIDDVDDVDGTVPLEVLPRVALSLNGSVEAVATARLHRPPDWYRFHLTVAESLLRPGGNVAEVWLVDPETPGSLYGPLRPAARK